MLFSELKCKEVINLKDCRCLGKIGDLEFDECSGQICKVIIPGKINFPIYSAANLNMSSPLIISKRLVRISLS